MQQGMQQGMQQEAQQVLTRLSQRKYGQLPPWVEEKIAQSTEEQLNHWIDKILDAESIEELFS